MNRSRWFAVWIAVFLFSSSRVRAQEFQIQLSNSVEGLTLFGGSEGQPLVFAPVPGLMPTRPDQLVTLPRVADDLELLPAQVDELKASLAKVREKFAPRIAAVRQKIEATADDRDRKDQESQANRLEADLSRELLQAVDDVLLPFQRDRLRQITAQSKLNNDGAQALQSEEFAKWLKLTPEQQRELETKQAQMQAQLKEEIRDLRRQRQREVIESVLNKSQIKILEDLLGQDLAKAPPPETPSDRKNRERR